MTVIVILALVALFIGLRLYSVLGERTGHEQQPILKPADQDARVERRVSPPPAPAPTPDSAADLAYVPLAGPGVRAILAADPSERARFIGSTPRGAQETQASPGSSAAGASPPAAPACCACSEAT